MRTTFTSMMITTRDSQDMKTLTDPHHEDLTLLYTVSKSINETTLSKIEGSNSHVFLPAMTMRILAMNAINENVQERIRKFSSQERCILCEQKM